MSTEKHADRGRKGRGLKLFGWILAGIFVFVLLLFFAVPVYLSSSGGTNMLLGKINKSVDGEVQMEDFSVGWFRGVKVQNLMFTDGKGQTSVKVQSVQAHPSYASLLGGKVKLGKTVIQSPQIDIKVPEQNSGQTSGVKTDASSVKAAPAKPFVMPVDQMDLELRDGRVSIELPGDIPQKVSFTNIASTVVLAEAGQNSQIDLSMQVADGDKKGGEIAAKGNLTADKGWTLKSGDFNVTVSKLQLSSLKPLFALAGRDEMDMSGELNADAAIRITDNTLEQIDADVTITDFAQGSGQQRISFEKPVMVSAKIAKSGEDITIERLVVDSAFCDLDCAGTMESLDYRVDTDLAQTQRFVKQFAPMDVDLGGKVTANGRMKLSDEAMAFEGKGTFTQFSLQKDDVKTDPMDGALSYDVTYDKSANLLAVRSANLDSDSMGMLHVKNMHLPLGDDKTGGLALDLNTDLNLEKTLSFAKVFVPKLAENQISGQLKAAAKIDTEGSRIHFSTQDATVDKLRIVRKDSEPFVQDRVTLDGDVVVDTQDKTIDIKTLDLQGTQGQTLIKITKGSIEKTVSQKQTEVKGNFEAEYDWNTVSALAPVPGLSVKGKRKGAFQFSSLYPTDKPEAMLANLNATGNLGFDSASYKGLNFGPTLLDMTIQKGLVDFIIPQTTVNEGTMQFAGSIDLKEEPKMLRLKNAQSVLEKVQINDAVSHSMLLYANPMFAESIRTSGLASFRCQELVLPLSKGEMNSATIKGTLTIDSLRMQAGDLLGNILNLVGAGDTATLTIHPTDFVLDKGFLSYDKMQVDVGSTPILFGGRIGLDQSLAMNVTIPAGDMAIPLPLGGTVTHPKLDTGKFLELQGKEMLRQGIEGLFK